MDNVVKKNYIYNLIYQITLIITPLITTPYVSRVLHQEGVGIFSYTSAIANGVSLFAALGIAYYGQREIAYYQDDLEKRSKVFFELQSIRVCTTVLALIVYLFIIIFYREYRIYLIGNMFYIGAVLLDISWFYQGIENFKSIMIRNLFIKLVSVACIFLLVKDNKYGTLIYVIINSSSLFVGNLLFWINIKKYIIKIKIKNLNVKRHLKGCIELFLPLIAVQIYSYLDKVMLGALSHNDVENGYYEQARKIIVLINTILISLNTVMFPRISNKIKKGDDDGIVAAYKNTIKFIFMILIPIIMGMYFITDNFVIWFFGEEYYKVVLLIKVSLPILLFMSIGNFIGTQYLIPAKKQNSMTLIYVISAVVNIILNMILIPAFQSMGALVGSIIAEAVSCIGQYWLFSKSKYWFRLTQGTWKYFVASALMCFYLCGINRVIGMQGIVLTFVQLIGAVVIYFIVLYVLKSEMLYSIIFNKRN